MFWGSGRPIFLNVLKENAKKRRPCKNRGAGELISQRGGQVTGAPRSAGHRLAIPGTSPVELTCSSVK